MLLVQAKLLLLEQEYLLAASEKVLQNFLKFYGKTRVGSDKINQAKHAKF